jgi:hypothetical protein
MESVTTTLFKDVKVTAFTLGVSTVILTHIAIITLPDPLDKASKAGHAYINLAAAGAIVWGSRIFD